MAGRREADGPSRGPWMLIAAAATLAVALSGAVAVRAVASEELAVAHQERQRLDGEARRLVDAMATELYAAARDVADGGARRTATARSVPNYARVVWAGGASTRPPEARGARDCGERILSLRGLAEADVPKAASALAEECPEARGPAGAPVVPFLFAQGGAVSGVALTRWIRQHGTLLRAGERTALAAVISHWPEGLRAEVEAALEEVPPAPSEDIARLRDALALAPSQSGGLRELKTDVLWLVARVEGERVVGVQVDEASLRRGLTALPLARPARASVAPVNGERAPASGEAPAPRLADLPLEATAWLTPALGLRLTPWDPSALSRRTQQRRVALMLAAALAVVAASAAVALVVARARQVERLSALRTDLVAAVSHELRTPVASIQMIADVLRDAGAGDPDHPALVDALGRDARRLHRTVHDLLRFGGLRAGRLVARRTEVSLAEVAARAEAEYRGDGPPRPAVLVEGQDARARIDADLVVVALRNLLGNAAKYAPDGGPYRLAYGVTPGGVTFAVQDRGPGVPPPLRQRIFEPYARGDDRLSEATEGSGLGLALVRLVAEAHGGRAWVDGEGGATFHIHLAREPA